MNAQIPTMPDSPETKPEMIVYRQQNEIRCVLTENGRPVEVIRAAESALRRQDLVLGVVRQVMPSLDAVFIDIGAQHDAWLPRAEARPDVKAGQTILVQIRKENAGGKGHRVTGRPELPGPYAVFLPFGRPRRRSKLRGFPAREQTTLFDNDLERLEQTWRQILQDSCSGPAPRLLHPFGDPCYTALISWSGPELTRIRVDDEDLYTSLYSLLASLMPQFLPLLHFHRRTGDYGLAAVLGLADLDEQLTRRTVLLDGGGSIVIDRNEALTAVDVNSGRDTRGRSGRELRLRVNLQAATAVAGALRLRNIGGMVIIDFLRSENDEDRTRITASLQQALTRDRARHKLYGFTAMGLFELTRTAL